jgi:hypothetical protein
MNELCRVALEVQRECEKRGWRFCFIRVFNLVEFIGELCTSAFTYAPGQPHPRRNRRLTSERVIRCFPHNPTPSPRRATDRRPRLAHSYRGGSPVQSVSNCARFHPAGVSSSSRRFPCSCGRTDPQESCGNTPKQLFEGSSLRGYPATRPPRSRNLK